MTAQATSSKNLAVLLGVFVVWQLVFIPAANTLEFLRFAADEDESGALDHVAGEMTGTGNHAAAPYRLLKSWSEMSGQWQSWSLFAPTVGRLSGFLEVELRWDTGRAAILLTNPNQPDDLHAYVRFGYSRFRKYESFLWVALARFFRS
ncbi:MAG: hypothetical protein L0Y72_12530 [Gemmataceae bacterium]|nr:hypothetical protein [Gemmataceae bacterium]MCI0739864.1 hypothetical protein [Gemmataceae bacterium]